MKAQFSLSPATVAAAVDRRDANAVRNGVGESLLKCHYLVYILQAHTRHTLCDAFLLRAVAFGFSRVFPSAPIQSCLLLFNVQCFGVSCV